MHKKIYKMGIIATTSLIVALSTVGCKQETGTSEDSPQKAIIDEREEFVLNFIFASTDMSNPYFETLEMVIKESLAMEGHTLVTLDAKNDPELQNKQIIEAINDNEYIDGIFISPVDWEGLQEALDVLEENEINMINIDSQIKTTTIMDAYVGSDNTGAGNLAGEALVANYPNGAKVMVLENMSRNSIIERINGFESSTAGKGFEIVARISTSGDKQTTKEEVKTFLQEGSNVEVIMAPNDQMALGALEAIKELDLEVQIISIDGSPEMKALIKSGEDSIIGTIAQSPINIGKKAVETAIDIVLEEEFSKTNRIETFIINHLNINIYGTESWQ